MPKLPNRPDPARLRNREPRLISLPSGSLLHRVYRRGGPYPTLWNAFRFFGPTSARFDHHLPDEDGDPHEQERGVFYAAADIVTALAETFQHRRTVNRRTDRPWLVEAAGVIADVALEDGHRPSEVAIRQVVGRQFAVAQTNVASILRPAQIHVVLLGAGEAGETEDRSPERHGRLVGR